MVLESSKEPILPLKATKQMKTTKFLVPFCWCRCW